MLVVLTVLLAGLLYARPAAAASETDFAGTWVDGWYLDGFGVNPGASAQYTMDTSSYDYVFDYKGGKLSSLKSKYTAIANYMSSAGAFVEAVSNGVTYKSSVNWSNSNVKISRSGKYLYGIEIGPIGLKNGSTTLPVTISWKINNWADKFYNSVTIKPTSPIQLSRADIVFSYDAALFNKYKVAGQSLASTTANYAGSGADGVVLINDSASGKGSVAHIWSDKTNIDAVEVKKTSGIEEIRQAFIPPHPEQAAFNRPFTINFQVALFGDDTTAAAEADWTAENHPLTASDFTLSGSSSPLFVGFDKADGTYKIDVPGNDEQDNYYGNQNQYDEATIAIANNATARTVRLKAYKAPLGSSIACGASVLTDANKDLTGIPLQVSAKWENAAHESAYYEAYAVIPVNASQSKTYRLRQTWQDWGKHLNVQLASQDLRDFDTWGQVWMSATQGCPGGGSTTDLFVPDRPIQDDMTAANGQSLFSPVYAWKQPNGGSEVLTYLTGSTTHSLKSDGGLRFNLAGPNLTEWTSKLRSDDGKVTATVTEEMLPADDMTRLRYKVHYSFNQNMAIGSPNANFRLFSVGDQRYGNEGGTPSGIAYKDPASGNPSVVNATETAFPVIGQALNAQSPYVSFLGRNEGNLGILVKSYSGTIGGQPLGQLAFTWERGARNSAYITPNLSGTLNVLAGDYIDMDVILYSYGRNTNSPSVIASEHDAWSNFQVSATTGTVLSQWLPNVALDGTGKARFTMSGGKNYVPLQISGFPTYVNPRLYELVKGTWTLVDQSVNAKDFYQTDYDASTGKYNVIYTIKTDGSPRTFMALADGAGSPPSNTYSGSAVDGLILPYSVNFPRYVRAEQATMTVSATAINSGTSSWTSGTGVYLAVEAFGTKTAKPLTGVGSHASVTDSVTINVPQHVDETQAVRVYLQDASGNKLSNVVADDALLFPLRYDFKLIGPSDGIRNAGVTPSFSWTKMLDATSYRVKVYSDAGMNRLAFEKEIPAPNFFTADPYVRVSPGMSLAAGKTYYWTVDGYLANGTAVSPISASSFTVAPAASSGNMLAGGTEIYSPTGGAMTGSFSDGTDYTYRNGLVYNRSGSNDFGISLTSPILINHVRYVHGHADDLGGWFNTVNGKPTIQVQIAGGSWVDVAKLDAYPSTNDGITGSAGLSDGQAFDVRFNPITVYGVKIVGVPASGKIGDWNFSSIGELQAFNDSYSPNLASGATVNYSRPGNITGSIADGDFTTFRVTWDGTYQAQDWYATTFSSPQTINKVRFGHGQSFVDGGWFDTSYGKPKVQVQLVSGGAWSDVATLSDYPDTTSASAGNLVAGQIFEQSFADTAVYGLRVIGKPASGNNPAQSFSSASELQAFYGATAFEALSPFGGATGVVSTPLLKWSASAGATSYTVLVDTDPKFTSPVVNVSGITNTSYQVASALSPGITYYWKAVAVNSNGMTQAGVRSFTVSSSIGSSNLLAGGTESYSRAGNISGSYVDGDFSTVRVTWDGNVQTSDWYAVTLASPQTINKVRYAHGNSYADGGWFDVGGGKPKIQVQLSSGGSWTDVATLDAYPSTSSADDGGLSAGQSFDAIFAPVTVYGVRVIGTPVQFTGTTFSFSSISELQAYNEPNLFLGGKQLYSRKGNSDQSFTDGNSATLRVTYENAVQDSDWFGVSLDQAQTINKVVFVHGNNYADGGWFDTSAGKPQIQAQLTKGGAWITVGILSEYPATTASSAGTLSAGQTIEERITPISVYGLRIFGKPASGSSSSGSFASISELQGEYDTKLFPLVSPLENATGISTLPKFAWGASAGATSYTLTVATNASFTSPVLNVSGITATTYTSTVALTKGTTYYWKVTAVSAEGDTVSQVKKFISRTDIPLTNLLSGGTTGFSRAGNVSGSLTDGDFATYRVTWDGTYKPSDWYAVTLTSPVTINTVRFGHGDAFPDGGWFVGNAQVQVQTAPNGVWITVADKLAQYPFTTSTYNGGLNQGQAFDVTFPDVTVYGVRIIGTASSGANPAVSTISASELQAYKQ